MPRSRKRKLLSKCLGSKLNGGPKPPVGSGGVRTPGGKTTANRILSASIAALLASPAVAQSIESNADTPRPLDEIIVTATKRAESIQDVPVSILALDSTMLNEHQVVSLDDYTKLMPGVSIDSFGPGQADISFRGITHPYGCADEWSLLGRCPHRLQRLESRRRGVRPGPSFLRHQSGRSAFGSSRHPVWSQFPRGYAQDRHEPAGSEEVRGRL